MHSMFDWQYQTTDTSDRHYILTIIARENPESAVICLEHLQNENHVLQLSEFVQINKTDKPSHGKVYLHTFSSINNKTRKEMEEEIARLNAESGMTCPQIILGLGDGLSEQSSFYITETAANKLIKALSDQHSMQAQLDSPVAWAQRQLKSIDIDYKPEWLWRKYSVEPFTRYLVGSFSAFALLAGAAILTVGLLSILGVITALTGGAAAALMVGGAVALACGVAGIHFFAKTKPLMETNMEPAAGLATTASPA